MTPEGRLHIEVVWGGKTVRAVFIRSSRPFGAIRIMEGKTLQQAVAGVPMLFSACGRAQGVAAVMAAEAALGIDAPETVRAVRMRLALGEIIHEYLWRTLIDWPTEAGVRPRVQALAGMRRTLAAALEPLATGGWNRIGAATLADNGELWLAALRELRDFLRREVLGSDPAEWLKMGTCAELEAWCGDTDTVAAIMLRDFLRLGRFGKCDVALMPAADACWVSEIAEAMRDETFAQRPDWQGVPLETGALARQRQHPLVQALVKESGNSCVARLVARLVELARLAVDGDGRGMSGSLPSEGRTGTAWVETARGLLMHRMVADGEQLLHYRVVAPTEWNFHPDGAVVQGLSGMAAASAEETRTRAEWLVRSLDPCVACDIVVRPA